MALIALLLALVMPAVGLLALVAMLVHASGVAAWLFGLLGQGILPISIVAIIAGHVALVRAKRYPTPQAWRGFAISGLVLGYGALVAFLLFIFLILATFQ